MPASNFHVGDRVEVWRPASGTWIPGTVTRITESGMIYVLNDNTGISVPYFSFDIRHKVEKKSSAKRSSVIRPNHRRSTFKGFGGRSKKRRYRRS